MDNIDKKTLEEVFEKYKFKDDKDAMRLGLLNFLNTTFLNHNFTIGDIKTA